MSGHSHFSSIKHKKAITDAKRGKVFSKLARQILVAAKEKGGDPETNSSLRMVIEKAKELNMPKDNVERAIKKGIGELESEKLEQVTYEAYGPGGIAIMIEGITDNKNRTLSEVKQILNQWQGKLADAGSVKWMFERKGAITIDKDRNEMSKDDLEMKAIEAGAEDFYWLEREEGDYLDVYTKIEDLETVKKQLENQGIKIESTSLDWAAKETIKLDDKQKNTAEKLFESLDENDAVQEIYSNLVYLSGRQET
ncbi:YebC/PmpR family DNA-binding transcriptional regulator [Candidatus Parcubacteria bacterium]|nr:YebC/PmpR family DNA-binding transcriptional regulator [Candidatus Parcubacteria bacterium]